MNNVKEFKILIENDGFYEIRLIDPKLNMYLAHGYCESKIRARQEALLFVKKYREKNKIIAQKEREEVKIEEFIIPWGEDD